jgi:hypothetical protein
MPQGSSVSSPNVSLAHSRAVRCTPCRARLCVRLCSAANIKLFIPSSCGSHAVLASIAGLKCTCHALSSAYSALFSIAPPYSPCMHTTTCLPSTKQLLTKPALYTVQHTLCMQRSDRACNKNALYASIDAYEQRSHG